MELKGKIIVVFDTNEVSDRFSKREFVIECAENPEYPELLKLEMIQDKCEHLDGYKAGDMVEVDINLKGRKWDDPKGGVKYFNTLQAWRIRNQGSSNAATQSNSTHQRVNDDAEEIDDLPF